MVHEVVHFEKLPRTGTCPKVVPPTTKHGIQFRDELLHILPALPRIGDLPNSVPEPFRGLGRRPAVHKIPPWVPQNTALLTDRTPQKHETSLPAP